MRDPCDRAEATVELFNTLALEQSRTKQLWPELKPTGLCHWCGDELGHNGLHCLPKDNDCADVHLKHKRFNRGNDQ